MIKALKYITTSQLEYVLNYKNLKLKVKEFDVVEDVENNDVLQYTIAEFYPTTRIRFNIDNPKLIMDDDTNNSKITLTKQELKDLRNKFLELGLSGINVQVDKLIKEVFLPRSGLLPKSLMGIIKTSKGVILCGPPGTGKTTFALQIGKVLGCHESKITKVTASSLLSKWLGTSEENVRKLFDPARAALKEHGNKSPLFLIIIDEIDSILKIRGQSTSSTTDTIVNQLLGEMDGLDQLDNVLVIGMTNRIDLLDPAAIRPGRFGSVIEFPLPDSDQRSKIYEMYCARFNDTDVINGDIDINELAKLSNGFSGADIENVFNQVINTYTNNILSDIEVPINQKLLLEIVNSISDVNKLNSVKRKLTHTLNMQASSN